ncbi:hypothetical protein PoB_002511800 [Plakobranchus ocellatus]|uniref:Uncharacterized protein n=1 Tax=Plakobranchus ocellatus TaxID=259542 RepID=A0AAV3ZUR2_9GAST|nr:hypothetical protein PoB_002511800 [Plakobranchus ocellatus]
MESLINKQFNISQDIEFDMEPKKKSYAVDRENTSPLLWFQKLLFTVCPMKYRHSSIDLSCLYQPHFLYSKRRQIVDVHSDPNCPLPDKYDSFPHLSPGQSPPGPTLNVRIILNFWPSR